MTFFIFLLGAAVGSFLKVVADRYQPHVLLWDKKVIGGRSRCPFCGTQLRWFELIPVFSFLWQNGRCRTCCKNIGWQYPLVEIISGFLFVSVPASLKTASIFDLRSSIPSFSVLPALWISVFLILLLIALIDIRLRIIPDEANTLLLILGGLILLVQPFGEFQGSFLKQYALLFGWRQNVWLNHLLAMVVAGAFFAFLILITKGRGMGVGDLKLASVLGFIFGWPDILLILILSFVLGSVVGVGTIIANKKGLKSYLAFGPFLAGGSLTVFAFGYQIVDSYFKVFKLFA